MANTNNQMRLKRELLALGTFPNIPSLMYIENQPFDKSLLPKLTWMQVFLSSSRLKRQQRCVAIIEIAQSPHKHSKSNEIRIPIQIENRCQEKNPERKFEYKKYRVSSDARTDNYWNPSRKSWSWITMTSQGENSGSFKQLRHGGEILGLVGTETKNIHTRLISKQHSRQTVS